MMQEVSERYQKLANGSDIFCIDTDVGFNNCYHSKTCHAARHSPTAKIG